MLVDSVSIGKLLQLRAECGRDEKVGFVNKVLAVVPKTGFDRMIDRIKAGHIK